MRIAKSTTLKEVLEKLNIMLSADYPLYLHEHDHYLNYYMKNYNEALDGIIGILKNKVKINEESINFDFKLKNFQDLVNNIHVQSVHISEYEKNQYNITVITKPLKLWKWKIGQFKIEWSTEKMFPKITKIGDLKEPEDFNNCVKTLLYPYNESEFLRACKHQHPHVSENLACFGNAAELIKTFWSNYNKGFNYCIQYLLTYSRSDSYVEFPYYLAEIGYLEDANILLRKNQQNKSEYGIDKIINGIFYNKYQDEITPEIFESWGCTGKKTTKKEILERLEKSRYIKAKRAIEKNIRYHPDINKSFQYYYNVEFEYICQKCGIGLTNYNVLKYESHWERVCDQCVNIHGVKCDNCGNYYIDDNALIKYYEESDITLCRSCRRNYYRCHNCKRLIDKHKEPNYNGLCEECFWSEKFSIFDIGTKSKSYKGDKK